MFALNFLGGACEQRLHRRLSRHQPVDLLE